MLRPVLPTILFLILKASYACASSTTLTTYYPSPTGNYDQLNVSQLNINNSGAVATCSGAANLTNNGSKLQVCTPSNGLDVQGNVNASGYTQTNGASANTFAGSTTLAGISNSGAYTQSGSSANTLTGATTVSNNLTVTGTAGITGVATVGGLTMASGAGTNKVLTSNSSGSASWQAYTPSWDVKTESDVLVDEGGSSHFSSNTVSCSSGYTLVGGGCKMGAGDTIIQESYPTGNSWRCRGWVAGTDGPSGTVYARCAQLQ